MPPQRTDWPHRRLRSRRCPSGFALVVTLSLMILLALLAVGLLSLSAVSLRSSSAQALEQAARANARVAMLLAIGDLQRLAGPDQRVTAGSNLLDTSPDSERPDGVSRPHLTGVWRSWKQEPLAGALNYESRKEADFLGWLTSASDPRQAAKRKFATTAPGNGAVTLVGKGTSVHADDHVNAEAVPLATGVHQGRLAWTVFDQGQKAMVSLPDVSAENLSDELAALAAPALPGLDRSASRTWDALAMAGENRPLLITRDEFQLAGLTRETRSFHDLTPASLALPVDVTAGRFASDLSLLFDSNSLRADYSRRFLYSDTETPLAPPPTRFRGAFPLPSPDPSWRLLHSHARAHATITKPASNPTGRLVADPRPTATASTAALVNEPAFNRQQLVPVIARAQFVFSIGFGASPQQATGGRSPGQTSEENWICWLVFDPVITLWNPYNVSLSFPDGMIELYRVPLAYQLFRNGQSFAPPTLWANSFLPAEFATRATRYYRLNLKPKQGQSMITLKPGEHLVFTAHSHVKHYQEAYYRTGVDLRPGWNEPAGEKSNTSVGGISSLNTFVNPANGNNSATINGQSARSLPVKPGDRVTLKVTTAGPEIDKFAETNNQEITAMLRYRINTGTTSPGSLPPLVGAIELEYGRDEPKLLPTYEPRDLPTLIVPSGIPRNQQGDNYVGTRPPPAVRYKEPFFLASLHLKTARDSRFPARGWLHNSPVNLYSTAGLDQTEIPRHHQFELGWESMTDWKSSPTIEIDALDRGFGGGGLFAQSGQNYAVFASLPLAPPLSLGQLSHAPLNVSGQQPLQTRVIGNSAAHPLLSPTAVRSTAGGRTFLDHSWLANQALFDRYFFSGAGTPNRLLTGKSESPATLIPEFLGGQRALANPRMLPLPDPVTAADPAELAKAPDSHAKFPASLGIAGAFNINSTSVPAWEAMLAALRDTSPPAIQGASGQIGVGGGGTSGEGVLVTRHIPPVGSALDGEADPVRREELVWMGFRNLTEVQIQNLARRIVAEVKKRGPFQSQAEFVNRRLQSGELAVAGAIQAAIDAAGLNRDALAAAGALPTVPDQVVPESHPAAATGTTADGATSVITQADVLTPLAPFITARSDTFLIRAYGEASSGGRTIRVWCEATVQRTPDFVDSAVPRATPAEALPAASAASRFGRRFAVTGFRWLAPESV